MKGLGYTLGTNYAVFNNLNLAGTLSMLSTSTVSFRGLAGLQLVPVGAAVPVPPTVWLFGSGLLGLLAFKRLRS